KNASLGINALNTSNNKALSHKVGTTFTRVLPYSEFGYRIPYAGGINMSIEDLAKYAQLHMNKGKINGQVYIPENIIDELHKIQIDTTGNEPYRYTKNFYPKDRVKNTGYGLGWRIYDWNGHKAIGHGGFVNGQVAMVSFLPEHKIGIAVLANAATPLGVIIRSYLFDRHLGLNDIDWLDRAKIIKARDKAASIKNAKHSHKKIPLKKEGAKKVLQKNESSKKSPPKKRRIVKKV
ncbi:MAG: serine hydrolase domain-containing protein, partial [Alphaproteobacteria bacterium]|nr:serine hydrolase domain-containing protein [Alphaproteobacteria bacterium]